MAEKVIEIVTAFGYPGIAVLLVLENLFPPVPSEAILPFAGFAAARGDLSFGMVVLVGTLASVAGALPLYFLGRLAGTERIEAWADRYGKWLTVSSSDVRQAREWFRQHGGVVIFVCRLTPGIRSSISIPAGLSNISLPVFLFYTTLAAALWTWVLTYTGFLLGQNYAAFKHYVDPVAYTVMGLLTLAFLKRWVARRRAVTE